MCLLEMISKTGVRIEHVFDLGRGGRWLRKRRSRPYSWGTLNEFPFPHVVMTHEPRRHSELGKLALSSVKLGNKTPLEEAGLFAADRLDHSHIFIRPQLAQGAVVVSDRNIHSR